MVSIARIVKTRGVRGEVAADLLTDFPERFRGLGQVSLHGPGISSTEILESFWFQRNRVILKFKGRDSPEEARPLVGCEVQIEESERVRLPKDTYFDSDLEGCGVYEGDQELGKVAGVLKTGSSAATLVVVDPRGREVMIPLIRQFVRRVAVEQQRIEVKLPPGLLELASESSGRPRRKRR